MTTYTFPSLPAVDASTGQVVTNTEGQVYDPADTSFSTPLTVTDLSGAPMASVKVGDIPITEQFMVDNHPQVVWKSGPYVLSLWAPQSLLDAATAAQTAAEAAAADADASAAAAATAIAPTNTAIDAHLGGDATNLVPRVAAKADLGSDGKVVPSQLPSSSGGTSAVYRGSVASQAAMLALPASQGDWCIRTDLNARFDLTGSSGAGVLTNWTRIPGGIASNDYSNAAPNAYFKIVALSSAPRPSTRTDIFFVWQTTDGLMPVNALAGDDWENAIEGP